MAVITLSGRLGADPTIEQNKKGESYMRFTVAEDSKSVDGTEEARWHTIIIKNEYVYGRGACKFLKKGSSVVVWGDYKDELYQKKDGAYTIVRTVYAFHVTFGMSSKPSSDSNSTHTPYDAQTPQAAMPKNNVTQAESQQPMATTANQSAATIKPKAKAPVVTETAPQPQADDDELPF